MRLSSTSSIVIFMLLIVISFKFLKHKHRARICSCEKSTLMCLRNSNTILVPAISSSKAGIIEGMVGVLAASWKWKSLLWMSTVSATEKTVLNPMPFSPISKLPEWICFFVDSPIAVMERTLSFENPTSLYSVTKVPPLIESAKHGTTPST